MKNMEARGRSLIRGANIYRLRTESYVKEKYLSPDRDVNPGPVEHKAGMLPTQRR
jgi:hypothetical protein